MMELFTIGATEGKDLRQGCVNRIVDLSGQSGFTDSETACTTSVYKQGEKIIYVSAGQNLHGMTGVVGMTSVDLDFQPTGGTTAFAFFPSGDHIEGNIHVCVPADSAYLFYPEYSPVREAERTVALIELAAMMQAGNLRGAAGQTQPDMELTRAFDSADLLSLISLLDSLTPAHLIAPPA